MNDVVRVSWFGSVLYTSCSAYEKGRLDSQCGDMSDAWCVQHAPIEQVRCSSPELVFFVESHSWLVEDLTPRHLSCNAEAVRQSQHNTSNTKERQERGIV